MKARLAFSELKDIINLSLPIIISQVGYVLMGFSDNLIVGKLGAVALAAAGVSNSVFFLIVVIGIGGLSILAPLVSKASEEEDHEKAGSYVKAGLGVATLYSILIVLLLGIAVYHFDFFGQPANVTFYSKEYLGILIFSVPPMMMFIALKQFTDGLSNTKIGMYVSIAGLIVNIILCFVLVYGYAGIKAMGLNGAAIATTLARLFMLIAMYVYVFTSKNFINERKFFFKKWFEIRKETFELFRRGFPNGLQMLAESCAFSLAAVMVGWITTAQLAAHQIVLSWAALSYMVSTGISIAVSIRVGAGLGAKDKSRILYASYVGLILVILYEAGTFATFVIGKEFLTQLFTIDPEVMAVAPTLMILMGLFQIPDGVQAILLGALRGLLDVNIPTYLVLFSYIAVCLPVAYLLGFTFGFQSAGIWFGLVIGLCLSSVLLAIRFHYYTRKIDFKT
ncbi:MAG: MATE family efflux transporter [Opitutaceae bacterium]|nr:MATE family efflux transporter [Cytophagales bacterium]